MRKRGRLTQYCAGVDGCRGGWLAIVEDGSGGLRARIHAVFADLVDELPKSAIVAVDIPIGLPNQGSRACDVEARQRLGRPRMSSVFPAPIRPVLAATDYEEACRIRRRIENKGMSRQAFAILPKVREVDEYLQRNPPAAERILEVHPEVSFACWRRWHAMGHYKKSREGKVERRKLIESEWTGEVERVRVTLGGGDYGLDDLHDAFAALWTARRWVSGEVHVLGENSASNAQQLPMRIVA